LHAEGFEQVEHVKVDVNTSSPTIASGQVDLWVDAAPSLVNFLDRSTAAVALGGFTQVATNCSPSPRFARSVTSKDGLCRSVG
jgi:hypothetical protein